MSFLQEVNAMLSDTEKYGEERENFMHLTGFDSIDYLNGKKTRLDNGTIKLEKGIDAGKIITIIGKSGSGKTAAAIQMGGEIIKKYAESSMIVLDFEQATTKERIRTLTGFSEKEYDEKVKLKSIGISTETVLGLISELRNLKLKHRKELEIPNVEGVLDENGKPKMILPPTVIVIDSIAAMMPSSVNKSEELAGQMQATAVAKINTQLFKRISMPCADANIIPIFINHINQKIETTVVPTQAQVNYLGQNETLPLIA